MPVPFHHNKLESIGDQLTVGCRVEEIAEREKCNLDTVYRVRCWLLLTGKATPIIPRLKPGPARSITPEIEEVLIPVSLYTRENG